MRKIQLIIFVVIGIFLGVLGGSLLLNKVAAKEDNKITICHCQPRKGCHTIRIDKHAWKKHKDHHGDHKGECKPEPTPTPTPPVCEWSEWSECRLEEETLRPACGWGTQYRTYGGDEDCKPDREVRKCEIQCEPSPTPTPTPTPTTKPEPEHRSEPGPAGAPQCEDTAPVKEAANPLVWRKGGSAIVQWQPTEGNNAHIYWNNLNAPEDKHALRDLLNTGYYQINDLGNKDWQFCIQQANGCAGGPIVCVDDGATDGWILFR